VFLIDRFLFLIEVKGRVKDADSVTKNEILTALNKPDDFLLAIVEVDGTQTVYLKKPFRNAPDFAAMSVSYNIAKLVAGSEMIME